MKKWIVALSLILFLALPAHANQVLRTVIAETTLTKGTSETSVTVATGDSNKLVVFIDYVPDNNESLTVTFDVSYDGTNWLDANFYDYSGGATLQTTESLTADAWYYVYWENRLSAPFVRIHTIGSSWSAAISLMAK